MTPNPTPATTRITLRLTPDQKQLLTDAAAAARTSLSEFVRHYALVAAREQLEGRIISLSPEAHAHFTKALEAPPRFLPKLRELFDLHNEPRRMPGPVEDFERAIERACGKRLRADQTTAGAEIWSALAGVRWRHDDGEDVRYSYRAASELVTFLLGHGDYDDWYMSGPIGEIADWIRNALAAEGWRPDLPA